MREFQRKFLRIAELKQEALFQKKLLPDINKRENGAVLPAFRGGKNTGYMSFYYYSGGIFEYNSKRACEFTLHHKYVDIEKVTNNGYVREVHLQGIRPNDTFLSCYEMVKENCETGEGPVNHKKTAKEAIEISNMYQYNMTSNGNIIFLDTEICLSDDGLQRIDILLYNQAKQKLVFCEAKHFSNSDLRSEKISDVVTQIKSYEDTILSRKTDILSQYQCYMNQCKELFGVELTKPEEVHPKVGLLVFGYEEEDGLTLFQEGGVLQSLPHYAVSTTNSIDMEEFFEEITK